MHASISILANGVRSRLECSRWSRRCRVKVPRKHQDEKDNK